jgi:hypothetical protein
MANPERPSELDPDRNPEYTVNPTFNNPIYPAEPRTTSRSVGGLAAAAIIAVVAFLALAFFGGGTDEQANAPGANQPAVEGTENPPTGSITPDPTVTPPTPQSDTAPQAAPEAPATPPATDTPAPAQPAPAQ